MTDDFRLIDEPQIVRDLMKNDVDGVPALDFALQPFDAEAKVIVGKPSIDFRLQAWFEKTTPEEDILRARVLMSPSASLPVRTGFVPETVALPSAAELAGMADAEVEALAAAVADEWMRETLMADAIKAAAVAAKDDLLDCFWYLLSAAYLFGQYGTVEEVASLDEKAWDDADESVRAAVTYERSSTRPPVMTREDLMLLAEAAASTPQ